MSTITERVLKGAAWLDVVRPGWEERVTLPTLDLSDGCKCVLGQVFEREKTDEDFDGFCYAVETIAYKDLDETEWPFELGFDAYAAAGKDKEEFAALQAEWLIHIEARKAALA